MNRKPIAQHPDLGPSLRYKAACKTRGFHNMWVANAFKGMDGQCFLNIWGANGFDTSGAQSEFPKWGRQAAPIMCFVSIKSIGLRIS